MEKACSMGVNVPAVRRIVPVRKKDHLILMQRIHGETLEQLWPRLSLWTTIRIAWQLRLFISALRTVTSQTTGGLCSGKVHSEWIQGINGPPHALPSLFYIAPRNMILDSSGHLWLVDWGYSGFYPMFMECLGMEGPEWAMPWLAARSLTAWWGRMRWSLFGLIACGYSRLYSKERAAIVIVRQRSLSYRLEKPVHSMCY
ncbi:kinase-like protein [Hysterangium stoloniferum]|nr:kinase-like protein [Hysterangium stoloniferum]